jgi:hypothetical protein
VLELRATRTWPPQYQEPGASQMRLAGSATHALLSKATSSILKIRHLSYLGQAGEGRGKSKVRAG